MQNEEYVKIKIRFNTHTVAVILILFSSYLPDFKHFRSCYFNNLIIRHSDYKFASTVTICCVTNVARTHSTSTNVHICKVTD